MSLIKEDGLYGAPDIIIEILSDFTAQYDFYDKNTVYARNEFTEHWIVNPGDKSNTGY